MAFTDLISRSWLPLIRLLAMLLAIFASCHVTVLADSPSSPSLSASKRHHPELTVLGYVTPWNARGEELVSEFRSKFDIVSPVWYTVHAEDDAYTVRGGPPSDEDAAWYRELQAPEAEDAKPVAVAPRFILDGWTQADHQALLPNATRRAELRDAIVAVVGEMHFDGVVLEAGMPGALAQPLALLSDALHADGKILVVVLPPLRLDADQHNAMVLQSAGALVKIADYVSVMTYDMTGVDGRLVTEPQFSPDSPAGAVQAQGYLRSPGANTNGAWVRENLEGLLEEAAELNLFDDGQVELGEMGNKPEGVRPAQTKFLAGLPLYGYTYPVFFVGADGGLKKPGQLEAAFPAENGLVVGDDLTAVMRGAGEAITATEIRKLVDEHEPVMKTTEDGEVYFDYAKGEDYRRVFTPAQESMARVLDVVKKVNENGGKAGIALWEVGQSDRELLEVL